MQTAPNTPQDTLAQPPILAVDQAEWKAAIPGIKSAFEAEVYGRLPRQLSLKEFSNGKIDSPQFTDSAHIEFKSYSIHHKSQDTGRKLNLVIALPSGTQDPVPVIMMQNFCPNHNVIPLPEVPRPEDSYYDCSGGGVMGSVFGYFFGRYITTPPIADIMNRGYALAVMYPSEFIPDNLENGKALLDRIFADQPNDTRTGALAAWAAEFSLVTHLLEADLRFSHQIGYGHSRFGKSALLAAAFDPAIDAVIAHQSGTGGASLTKGKPGETLENITQGYPFWFSQTYAGYAGRENDLSHDQHFLLGLIAPRPVLLGNAKRDVWSDPEGAFRAAKAASKVYGFYGSDGLRQTKLTEFDSAADIAFWMRRGTHGVVKEDWPAFLDFLDAHFK